MNEPSHENWEKPLKQEEFRTVTLPSGTGTRQLASVGELPQERDSVDPFPAEPPVPPPPLAPCTSQGLPGSPAVARWRNPFPCRHRWQVAGGGNDDDSVSLDDPNHTSTPHVPGAFREPGCRTHRSPLKNLRFILEQGNLTRGRSSTKKSNDRSGVRPPQGSPPCFEDSTPHLAGSGRSRPKRGSSGRRRFVGAHRRHTRPSSSTIYETSYAKQSSGSGRNGGVAPRTFPPGVAGAEREVYLRSRGDLVGLRRTLSRADPSASGVLSKREFERAIVRRFGADVSRKQLWDLAAHYSREFNGRSVIDFHRLVDTLEARQACPATKIPREGDSCSKGHARERAQGSSGAPGDGWLGGAAIGATGCKLTRDHVLGGVPPEEGQLVRRARSKTLALIETHGSRSMENVFRRVDPGLRR